jgi:integrase
MSAVNRSAGSVRQLESGKWQATLVLGEGRGAPKTTKTFGTRRAAKEWLVMAKQQGVASGPPAAMTLGDAFDVYVAENALRANTAETYHHAKTHAVEAGIADRRLGRLDRTVQTIFTTSLVRKGLAPATTNLYAEKLNAVLRYAADKGAIGFVPRSVKVPVDDLEVPAITVADVRALLEVAPDEFAPAIILGAFAGLRASEAAAVTVADVDWLAGTVTVAKAVDHVGAFVKTKTSKTRIVPLAPDVVAQLSVYAQGKPSTDTLSTNLNGGVLTAIMYQKMFRAVADEAGLSFTSHALRKFFATTLLANGVNPKAAAKYLGDSLATMLKTYALVQHTDAELARTATAAAFAATVAA